MSKRGKILLAAVLLLWLAVACLLFFGAARLPVVQPEAAAEAYTYVSQDDYEVAIAPGWQVSVDEPGHLLLIDPAAAATIELTLEVGGYDFYSPADLAGLLQQRLAESFDAVECGELKEGGSSYNGVSFAAILTEGKQSRMAQCSVLRVLESVRIYAVFAFPDDVADDTLRAGLQTIGSVRVFDAEALYAKYL